MFAFLRVGADGSALACLTNFGATTQDHQLGVPVEGDWEVILNTNSGRYHDSGEPASFRVTALADPDGAQPASLRVTLPALTTLWIRPVGT